MSGHILDQRINLFNPRAPIATICSISDWCVTGPIPNRSASSYHPLNIFTTTQASDDLDIVVKEFSKPILSIVFLTLLNC